MSTSFTLRLRGLTLMPVGGREKSETVRQDEDRWGVGAGGRGVGGSGEGRGFGLREGRGGERQTAVERERCMCRDHRCGTRNVFNGIPTLCGSLVKP